MMSEPLTKDEMEKTEPLTHEKIYCVEAGYIAPTGFKCNFSHCKKAFLMDDVLSAVRLLREKIEKRKLELERIKPDDDAHEQIIASAIFELMFFLDWIDEVFGRG